SKMFKSSKYFRTPRLHADFVLPSSSSSEVTSSYPPPPPPPRKRVLTPTPLPTNSRAKRAIFSRDAQASGEEENEERRGVNQRQDESRSPPASRQNYPRNAKNVAAESLAKMYKHPKKD
ncbi:hypothetical protein PMAYCL1PPCAC_32695, partial [Pristionchus mayeri]